MIRYLYDETNYNAFYIHKAKSEKELNEFKMMGIHYAGEYGLAPLCYTYVDCVELDEDDFDEDEWDDV